MLAQKTYRKTIIKNDFLMCMCVYIHKYVRKPTSTGYLRWDTSEIGSQWVLLWVAWKSSRGTLFIHKFLSGAIKGAFSFFLHSFRFFFFPKYISFLTEKKSFLLAEKVVTPHSRKQIKF